GLGGYDLYYSKYNGKYWDKPVNLTSFFNTADDELTLKINPVNPTMAFISVRKISESKLLRLFRITFSDPYSLNRFTNVSNAMRFVAGADVTPFETAEGSSAAVAQTSLPRTETGQPDLKQQTAGQPASQATRQGTSGSTSKPAERADYTPEK